MLASSGTFLPMYDWFLHIAGRAPNRIASDLGARKAYQCGNHILYGCCTTAGKDLALIFSGFTQTFITYTPSIVFGKKQLKIEIPHYMYIVRQLQWLE